MHNSDTALTKKYANRSRYLYPPDEVPQAEMQWGKTWQWLQMAAAGKLPGTTKPPPFACTQLPGEIMVVPRVWWHATLNGPGATFALGTQEPVENMDGTEEAKALSETSVHSLNEFLATKDYEGAEKRARQLLGRNPAELPVHASLSQLLVFRGAAAEAQQHMDAVVSKVSLGF